MKLKLGCYLSIGFINHQEETIEFEVPDEATEDEITELAEDAYDEWAAQYLEKAYEIIKP